MFDFCTDLLLSISRITFLTYTVAKKNYPSLTNYFALRLAFNTRSLKGVTSMEKEPQTHEMSSENALFPQNQPLKCPLRNANELSLLETF